MYIDRDAILEPRDVVFEGGEFSTSSLMSSEVSNPTVPDSQSMLTTDSKDAPPPAENSANFTPTSEINPTPSKARERRDSLAGLPQFDEAMLRSHLNH